MLSCWAGGNFLGIKRLFPTLEMCRGKKCGDKTNCLFFFPLLQMLRWNKNEVWLSLGAEIFRVPKCIRKILSFGHFLRAKISWSLSSFFRNIFFSFSFVCESGLQIFLSCNSWILLLKRYLRLIPKLRTENPKKRYDTQCLYSYVIISYSFNTSLVKILKYTDSIL